MSHDYESDTTDYPLIVPDASKPTGAGQVEKANAKLAAKSSRKDKLVDVSRAMQTSGRRPENRV